MSPPLVLLVAIEIVQVPDVTLLQAHQTGQALHVLVPVGHRESPARPNAIDAAGADVRRLDRATHVALPSLRKTQETVSLSVAATTFTDTGFSCSVMSYWAGVALANFLMFTSADASTFL